jgi:predicted metalloprotease
MKGVNGEDSRYEGALPEALGHSVKNEKEQEGVGHVKEKVYQMMPPRVQSEQLTVEHVGYPGQGMPVANMEGCKSPGNVPRRQTRLYVTVSRYVFVVIKIDELVIVHLPVNGNDSYRQKEAYE